MRALTVKAPWAWAIIHAGKDVENRTWSTSYRGTLAIHAGKGCTRTYHAWAAGWMAAIGVDAPALDDLAKGCVIGTVDLVDCVRASGRRWGMPDSWHWILRDPRPIQPRFVRGSLGLWTLGPSFNPTHRRIRCAEFPHTSTWRRTCGNTTSTNRTRLTS